MNRRYFASLAAAAAFALVGLSAVAGDAGSQWTYPAVPGFGRMHPLPDAAMQPNKNTVYKAVFDVTKGIDDPSKPDAGLDHVARAVNVFASAGVPLSHLKFVAVLHGPATAAILDNAHYRAKYGVDNPNIALISALGKVGVEVEVCGQALADLDFQHDWVNKEVTITLSALSDLVIYGNQGYAFVKQ